MPHMKTLTRGSLARKIFTFWCFTRKCFFLRMRGTGTDMMTALCVCAFPDRGNGCSLARVARACLASPSSTDWLAPGDGRYWVATSSSAVAAMPLRTPLDAGRVQKDQILN